MLQALLAGVASVKAQQTRMNVIGNNLANVNTTAYKSTSVSFQDMISQTIRGASAPTTATGGTNPLQYGLGVAVGSTEVNNAQGSLSSTNVPSDLAIQGSGYFMVKNDTAVCYTRDGSFNLDANGDVVQGSTGDRLLGWTADALGNVNTKTPITTASTLTIPIGKLNAVQATTSATMKGNLSADAAPGDTYTAEMTVYDSLGTSHDVTVEFSNHSTNLTSDPSAPAGATQSWDWKAYAGTDTSGALIGSSSGTGSAKIYADGNGDYLGLTGATNTITLPASNGTTATSISMDFSGISQLATDSQVAMGTQNGFPPGSLDGYSIGNDGTITGLFTNGLTRSLGQVALADFSNPDGLSSIGSNMWQQTNNSGIPVVGTANTGGRGTINAGYLEQSNVDISSEFSDLIITQRGFQANTKIITTVDEMLQTLIDMKR